MMHRVPTQRIAQGARAAGAFTLVEILLTLVIMVLIAGTVILSLGGTLQTARTRECAVRMAALLRAARAEAANAGRRFRLSFDSTSGQPGLTVERDPLGAPNVFEAFNTAWAEDARLEVGVRLASFRKLGDSAIQAADPFAIQAGEQPEAEIMFLPDGSSDSARLVLASEDDNHPWAVEITLNGVDGTVTTRDMDPANEPME